MSPGIKRTATIDITQQNFTGINHWWSYEEGRIPGVGRWMINAYSGNLIVQADDLDVPHRGIDLAFRRTYNSFSRHDFAGYDGANEVGQYGNGWTNTWDAHISTNGCPNTGYSWAGFYGFTVHDIDGARYDYCFNSMGQLIPPQGMQGTSLVANPDGGSFYWTKKSGTQYTFYAPYYSGTSAAYSGRIYRISGRGQNNYIQFSYAWSPDASSSANLTNIYAATDNGGSQATLTFATFGAQQLLSQLTRPDGATITYDYDTAGELISVSKPAPNNSGIPAVETYNGYQSFLMVAGPRWNAGGTNDGGYVAFYMDETTTAQVDGVEWVGVMNFMPNDGTSTFLQPSVATGPITYRWEDVRVTPTYTSFSDTDGHSAVQYLDGIGRPTSRQEYTGSQWLQTIEGWDAFNNLTAETDPRGYETDYAWDAMGNAIAVALPQTTTSEGTFRPTALYDYDAYNNVTSYCDPSETHAAGADWTSPPSVSDTLCSSHGVAHTSMSFSYPASEPYGQLTAITTPMGYSRHIAYDVSKQGAGGSDFGLPTSVRGDPITQSAGQTVPAQVTPLQTYQYDVNGNVVCFSDGVGTSVIQYDALGRLTAYGDPDDGSLTGCGKASSSYTTASYKAYFPDGRVKYTETPIQHAADVASGSTGAAVAYSYDLDGNAITETHHHGCATTAGCTAGVTTKWYDGADRLVEIMMPYDAKNDYHTYSWLTRHLYDMSGGGAQQLAVPSSATTSATSTQPFSAYGNLYDTQEYVDLGWSYDDSAPRWVDHLGNAFDALDRKTASYDVARGPAARDSYAYDQSTSTLGLQATHSKATGEVVSTGYDELGHIASVTYSASGVTNAAGGAPSRTYSYNARGSVTRILSALGTESLTYDGDGKKITDTEPAAVGGNTVTSSYAGNGWKTSLSTSGAMNATLFQYSRLPNGTLAQQLAFSGGWKTFTWQSTAAGRLLQRTDPTTGRPVSENAPLGILMAHGTASVFGPLTYAYNNVGALSGQTYSDGIPVNNISADLEGNQSYQTFVSESGHVSEANPVTVRGEDVGAYSHVVPATFANGIRLPSGPGPFATPQPGWSKGDGVHPVSLVAVTSPGYTSAYNPLDGFAMTTTGTFYNAQGLGTDYTNAYNYDASGRLTSTDLQQCTSDNSGHYTSSDSLTTYTYDADDHVLWQSDGSSSFPATSCTFGPPFGSNTSYAVNWGTNGHPISITFNSDNTPYHTVATWQEYLHWDGDTLLFTSGTPSGPPDNIKVGSIAEIRPSDGAIQVFDRDSAGEIWDSHNTLASGWNDQYGRFGGTLGNPNPAPSFGNISEPRPENVTAFGMIAIQGVRGVDGNLTQWTTPDAYAGSVHDPASQKPYMYEGNNSYAYSDPSGYCAQRIDGPSEDCGQGGEDQPIIIARGGRPHPPEDEHPKTKKTGPHEPEGPERPLWSKIQETFGGLETKPRPPTGSVPIDQSEYRQYHRPIKKYIGNNANDKTSISPNGDVWRYNRESNNWTNFGSAEDMIYRKKGKK